MGNARSLLASIPFFSGLSAEQLLEVGRVALEKHFAKGEIIFSEGDEGEGFYLIIEGTVKVFKLSPEGKEHILHLFSAGRIFGEVPVFAGEHFPANAEAIADTRVLFFPRSGFLSLIQKNPVLAMKMLADLSHKLRLFTSQIENLSLKEIPARLAAYLLFVADEQGRGGFVDLQISKGQLASLLGTIPETLSRVFAKLSTQKLIRVEGRKIVLMDAAGLRELAEAGKGSV
ncbi:MAG: Crp/Fnr family transcriptional regulator [Desulfobacterales bacterium]|jgi:CRP/FNR family transcriptional regulator|nr:Crp/Fnr family transcriptional regulator [Desulfobacterales bacterium]